MGLEGEVFLRDGAAHVAEEEQLAVLPRPLVEHLPKIRPVLSTFVKLDQPCQPNLTSTVNFCDSFEYLRKVDDLDEYGQILRFDMAGEEELPVLPRPLVEHLSNREEFIDCKTSMITDLHPLRGLLFY